MKREARTPRPDAKEKIEHFGLTFHTLDGQPYWNEAAAYRFEPNEIGALESATDELHRMCLAAAEQLVKNHALHRLSIPQSAHAAIAESWRSNPPSLYGRFDLSYDGLSSPKLLEYNADTPTSLLEAAVIQWHWLQDVEPQADQFNSIWDGLVEQWQNIKLGSRLVHFACVDVMEDVMTTAVLMDTAAEAGLEVNLMQMHEIGWDHGGFRFVDKEFRPIQTLFKLYPWESILSDKFGPLALKSVGNLQWIEPIWKMLLSNKGILAILWEMFPHHPNLLPAYLDGPRDLTDYVKKPLLGREGANVSIVQGAHDVRTDGPYGEGSYVYQAYAPLPVFEGNHAVIGSWVIGGKARGIGVRESDGPITEDNARFVPHYFVLPRPASGSKMDFDAMNAAVIQLAPIRVVMFRHTGPYDQISAVFDQLWAWVNAHGVPAQRLIGIYWDNPDYVAASRLRSAACVEIPSYYQLTDNGGLPLSIEAIAGGAYVTTRYVGPYEDLAPVWSNLTRYIEHSLGRGISSNPAFEVYVNDPDTTPPDQLITELYMPIL